MSQAAIELRIQAFEQFEACVEQDAKARPCCKQRGALRSSRRDRDGNTVTYTCRVCGSRHRRIFTAGAAL